jgi:hypothetical protein
MPLKRRIASNRISSGSSGTSSGARLWICGYEGTPTELLSGRLVTGRLLIRC